MYPLHGATWRILPMFLARHLWRAWKTVERVVMPAATPPSAAAPTVPARTERRWRGRFAASARMLVVLLAASGGVALEALASRTGLDASRAERVVRFLLQGYGCAYDAAMTDALAPGTVVARDFRVVRPLSSGGMGSVYVVNQLSTGSQRALKVMHPLLASDAKLRERFEQEARTGARIESEHVVQVISAGVDEATQTPFLVMELLAGEELAG